MKPHTSSNLTISPTLLAVMQHVAPEQLDHTLRKAYPEVFVSAAEKEEQRHKLLNRLERFVPLTPIIGIEEALRRTREGDFVNVE